ncbi:hypothetical protein L6164_023377 [Bauhinia variegata]|uniref:Uncharacterized protein n=1 Tax=Bauhinia variegata TaxID=167791 RepID=A0ACB9MIG1_BAUVA|nr:hypothetical protein L6164_023377 [Bauhinia variegata]
MLAETVIGALLQMVFDRVVPGGSVFTWMFGRNDADKAEELFNNLKMLLLSVKAVLDDAEEKQMVDPNVKAWVDIVGKAVYDADDFLDEITTIDLQHKINELGALLQLYESLSIAKLENVVDAADASEAKLQEMKFLDELELTWTNHVHNSPSDEENVLGHLQPHKYLRKLKIENYGGQTFPNWLGNPSFSNIVSIHLIGCRNCSSLPQLGQLLSLEILHVAQMTRIERMNPDFYGNKIILDLFDPSKLCRLKTCLSGRTGCQLMVPNSLPLKSLRQKSVPVLVEDTRLSKLILSKCQVQSFPDEGLLPSHLASLHISRQKLISLDQAGLEHLTSLKHLDIHDCVKLEKLPAEGLPQSLWSLIIKNCPQLVGHCQMHRGQYWHLIYGIEDLVIDK